MTVRHKLLSVLVVTALVTSVVLAVGAVQLVRDAVRERYQERIGAETRLLASWVAGPRSPAELQEFAVLAGARLGYRVTLIAGDGVVLADSSQDEAGLARMENHNQRPEVRQAVLRGTGDSERLSDTTGTRYFYHAVRVDGPGPVRIVRAALTTYQVERAQLRYAGLVILVAVVALALLCTAAYLAVRRLSKPLETMTAAAERVAGGDLRVEVPRTGGDEIARMAESVNRMKTALVRKIEDVDAERRLLASVVSGIKEGLLLIGPDRRVRVSNEAFRRIFGVSNDAEGLLLAEVIRNPEVNRELDVVLAGHAETREMVVRSPETGRSFELHAAPVQVEPGGRPGGALALFFDITRLEALENVRQEFVANVSHELRTPLTSIRAFVETLLEGGLDDVENRERFLRIVQRHADYMGELIDDLTDLSRIETGAVVLERAPAQLRDLARDVVAQVLHRHPAARVEVHVDIPDTLSARIDRRRMGQVLVNLVDNAVKFSRPGGEVRVAGSREGDVVRLEVHDGGIGIPSESLDRIFNRFYRVDRARSKDVPGTGLGLAIVKHLMRLHGGSVRVRSELGRGSTFVLEFPAA